MAITTYLSLTTTVEAWSHRGDVAGHINDFIDLTESLLNQELRLSEQESRETTATSIPTVTLPSDFLEIRSVRLNGSPNTQLIYMTQEMADYRAVDFTSTGKPTHYTIDGETLRLFPSPDASYTVDISYFAKIPALDGVTTSNFVLARWPQVYLHGCLYFCGLWARNADMATSNKQLFDQQIATIKSKNRRRKTGDVMLRTEISGAGGFNMSQG